MATGFQVINDNGILQIDEFFRNMVLVARGTAQTSSNSGVGIMPYQGADFFELPYPVAQRQPVVAVRCAPQAGNSYGITWLVQDDRIQFFSLGNNVVFEYFIYDRIDFGNASGNTGMQVFNAEGVEVFNSNNNYMKVLGSYDVNIGPPSTVNTVPPPGHGGSVQIGKRCAVAMGVQSNGYYLIDNGSSGGGFGSTIIRWWQSQVLTPSDNEFQVWNAVINLVNGVGGTQYRESGVIASYNSGLILDVTGL